MRYLIVYRNNSQLKAIEEYLESKPEMLSVSEVIQVDSMIDSYERLSEGNSRTILNNTLPIWNANAYMQFKGIIGSEFRFIASYELSKYELWDLYEALPDAEKSNMIIPVYGHIPMMYTKNCIKKTTDRCNHSSEFFSIKDRKGANIPIYSDCRNCRNIIYNSVTLSLHEDVKNHTGVLGLVPIKLEFTKETPKDVIRILDIFYKSDSGYEADIFYDLFSCGHFRKKVL